MYNPQKYFFNFLTKLDLPVNLKKTIFEGFSTILEKQILIESSENYQKIKFTQFLESIKIEETLKKAILEGFQVILEEFTYSGMDPSAVFSFGNSGFDIYGQTGPMFDQYQNFRIASGGTDEPNYGAAYAGFDNTKTRQPNDKSKNDYKYPKAVLQSGKSVKKLIKQANRQIPPQSTLNGDPTIPFQRYNYSAFNSGMFFN